jgi:hypothetical protein
MQAAATAQMAGLHLNIVVERELRGQGTYYHARPAAFRQGEGMFGGNFVYTSGSPYFENFDGRPIAVHDRIE